MARTDTLGTAQLDSMSEPSRDEGRWDWESRRGFRVRFWQIERYYCEDSGSY